MQLRQPLVSGLVATAGILLFSAPAPGQDSPCPTAGASLQVKVSPPAESAVSTVDVLGSLLEASCASVPSFPQEYTGTFVCDPATPETCETTVSNLQPGLWMHTISVTAGDSAGQFQARRGLLLSATSGAHSMTWPLFRSVTTVVSLSDGEGCVGCLREAITHSDTAAKPALIQFSPKAVGTIALSVPLPPVAGGHTTIDGFDGSGRPHMREIDGNGIDAPALKLTSANNTILGLRVRNTGGNSDTVLVEGPDANDNVLEELHVIGRGETVCDDALQGCLLDGQCRNFECGDDAIAIRFEAGQLGENVVRNSEVVGAFDKGVKVSNGARGRVERSHIHGNRDGGLQATLSGDLVAVENLIERNRGTNSANGLAANGSDTDSTVPSRLRTQGNISRGNSLRGISVLRLSEAILRDDHVCGNGTPERGIGFGLLVDNAGGLSAAAMAEGLAVVHNLDGGVVVSGQSLADLGGGVSKGLNAFAFNGAEAPPTPVNLRNLTSSTVPAANNHWEHCGNHVRCNRRAVLMQDVFQQDGGGVVIITPPRSGRRRATIEIDSISPTFATRGELVRIYGRRFDAIQGNAPTGDCDTISEANSCRPPNGNCVMVGGQPAEVIAVTPTMLVIRAPFTCFEPTTITMRNGRTRGVARHDFCLVD